MNTEQNNTNTEDIIKIERQRLINLVNMLPVYVVFRSSDYRILFTNRFFEKRFGKPDHRRCFEYLFNKDRPCEICRNYKNFERGGTSRRERTGPDGRYYDVYNYYFIDTDGSKLVMEIGVDITERKQVEEILRNTEIDLKHAQSIAKTGSWRLNIKNNKLIWSDEAYRIFGLPKDTLLTFEIFLSKIHPEDRNYVIKKWEEALQGKEYDIEHRIIANDKIKWVRETAELEFDQKNKLLGAFGTVQDITGRKAKEQIIEKYAEDIERERAEDEALLSSIGDGVVAIDTHSKILFVNNALLKMFNHNFKQAKGKPLEEAVSLYNQFGDIIPNEKRPELIALKTSKKVSTNIFDKTIFYNKKNKLKIPTSIVATPVVMDGKTIGAVAVYRDMAKDFEIDRAKTEFLSMAAHQLRTPLAEMSLNMEMLLGGYIGEVDKKIKQRLMAFYSETRKMNQLIKTFLDVSRMDMGSLEIKPVHLDPANVVNEVVKSLNWQIKIKKLHLVKKYNSNMPLIFTDHKILFMAIENILSNAINYTPKGGTICIKIKKQGAILTIEINDNGCGIPEDDQKIIFNKLFRGKNVGNTSGTGLGLYIAKYSIEKCGGKIWLKSKENKGTTFYLSLPIKKINLLIT